MRELLAGRRNDLVVEVEGDSTQLLADLRRQPYVISAEDSVHSHSDLHRIRLEVTDSDTAQQSVPPLVVTHDVVFVGLKAERKTLEDVFLAVTGGVGGERETRTVGR
jgi:hypothetical protein